MLYTYRSGKAISEKELNMKRLILGILVCCSLLAASGAAWCGDNGNGTVTLGNLVVLKDAGCLERRPWKDAIIIVNYLSDRWCGLSDKSQAGDWRLPTIDELQIMYASQSQFKNVKPARYWSSSTYSNNLYFAWFVNMSNGSIENEGKGNHFYIWPVRKK